MEVTIIKIALAIIFTLSVIAKLAGKTKSTFENAGYSLTMMYAIAIAEIIFTIGLFTKYGTFSALALMGIMGGAVFTLFREKVKPAKYLLPGITAVLLIALLVLQSKSSLFM